MAKSVINRAFLLALLLPLNLYLSLGLSFGFGCTMPLWASAPAALPDNKSASDYIYFAEPTDEAMPEMRMFAKTIPKCPLFWSAADKDLAANIEKIDAQFLKL